MPLPCLARRADSAGALGPGAYGPVPGAWRSVDLGLSRPGKGRRIAGAHHA